MSKVKQSKQPAPAFRPVVAQAKKALPAQGMRGPVAPPVYRPQPVPKVLQTKRSMAQPREAGQRLNAPATTPKPATAHPVAPRVYKPQPVPKVLQRKTVVAQPPLRPTLPFASPRTAPRPVGPENVVVRNTLQPKMVTQLTTPMTTDMHPVGMRLRVVQMAAPEERKTRGGGGGGGGGEEEPEEDDGKMGDDELAVWLELDEEQWVGLGDELIATLKKLKGQKKKESEQLEVDKKALASCRQGKSAVEWVYGGQTYHVNTFGGTYHVTLERSPKVHYFFKGAGEGIEDAQPEAHERSRISSSNKKFSALPRDVQRFVKKYWKFLLKK